MLEYFFHLLLSFDSDTQPGKHQGNGTQPGNSWQKKKLAMARARTQGRIEGCFPVAPQGPLCATGYSEVGHVEFDQVQILTEKVAENLTVGALSRTRNTYRSLATSFHEAEADLNLGLKNIQQLVSSTAMATTGLGTEPASG